MAIIDNHIHQGLRRQLKEELAAKGIHDKRVLEAIGEVPRHVFMDSAFLQFAYKDTAFPIGADQTISQPFTVAKQSSLLEVKPGMKVLEIGTGSGYQSAVLDALNCKVFSIERQKLLFKKAKKNLSKMKTTVKVFYGDGFKGIPAFAPYERVIITCGAPYVPDDLLEQLVDGGIMVIPLGEGGDQEMLRIRKVRKGQYEKENHGVFKFVPMLPDKQGI
ncbi:MAG: protein-L-isoaspartate(D-aspartate) O-methyltransferase [Flavobacteriales bacterium]|nr:protein-L-isoaspartate(D-aspartate) O-methyltransferase [Flavobacteriales bacterium]